MGLLRRNRTEEPPPDGLSMVVDGIFWIGAPPGARLNAAERRVHDRKALGVVVTGEVTGNGVLRPGDLVADGEQRFPIVSIEAFREKLDRVEPPRHVGLALGATVSKDAFVEGQQLRFER